VIIEAGILNNDLKVTIKDSGIGIREENQKYIFGRFKKLDNTINDVNKGYGLGLTVCQELVNMFGGSITLQSKENEGSSFTIQIPESTKGTVNVVDDGNEMFFEDTQIF
jgi:signal transduction histidine kinase